MALKTLGQLIPQIQVPPQDDLDASQVSLTRGWLSLPWHLIAFPTRKTTSLLVHLLLSFKSQSAERPFRKSPQLSCEGAERHQGQSGQHPVFFFFSLLNIYIYCPHNIPCTGTVTSLYLISPQQTTKVIEKLLRKEGRKGERTDRREGRREAWWRKERYRIPLLG